MKPTLALTVSLMLAAPLTYALTQADVPNTVLVGQDIDNGLGSLPPYREWYRLRNSNAL